MSKKRELKDRLIAFRAEPEMHEELSLKARELRVSCSWLVREYVRRGLLNTEEQSNGNVRKVRNSGA